ncbi:DUF4168 domain-containing protein [Aurantiacibacter suaedae]|uniref:DUF4168 domain-containing protein n=1 Tax=Aurantiacibacter suaedae TaxID=2545755 RepID=UPI0010F7A09A|nr:DUF4168 domain-containing protein [Aurantiacibacter suaedae]
MKTFVTLAAGGLLLASPAVAQMADSTAGAQAPMTDAASFTDEEIGIYAEAAVEISELHGDASLDAEARQNAALAVLEQSGLAPQRFNEISDAARSNPELAQRVQLAIASAQGDPGA